MCEENNVDRGEERVGKANETAKRVVHTRLAKLDEEVKYLDRKGLSWKNK